MRALILWAASALGPWSIGAAAAFAQTAPVCVPSTLNASALLGGRVTVSPLPGSRDATAQTQISFLGAPAADISMVGVTGSRSGAHAGRLLAYSQGDGASFVPSHPFAEGERVTVRARLRTPAGSLPISDLFAIAAQDPITTTPETVHPGVASQVQSFRTRPDLHPPVVSLTARAAGAQEGDLFLAPYTGPGQAGPLILAPDGTVLWFQPLASGVSASNFRVQGYAGRPVLTWWQGDISVHGFGLGSDVILDSSYRTIAHVRAGNGLSADLHEFQLTPSGGALLTAYEPILCDLSSVHGSSYGAVIDGVVQEVDVRTGLVRRQWTSLDHVALAESYEHVSGSSTVWPYDFFHVNSVNLDADGGMLVSARNTWAVYDLDGPTGQIVWRLGGRMSSFVEGPGARSAWQHDARPLGGGVISLFDNGSSPTVHHQSRGELVQLDLGRRTATLVGEVAHSPAIVAESQGNVQALDNGDWLVGWGQVPEVTEYGPQGQVLLDAQLPPHTQSYRDFRFAWAGMPLHAPALRVVAEPGGGRVAYASWNGATLLASWRLLTGATPASMTAVAEVPRAGFETGIPLPAATAARYVAVQALDAFGATLGASAVRPLVAG